MLPAVSIIIPMYMIMRVIGILDNVLSLIVSYTTLTLPFSIWILKSYFQTIPRDLEDAARVDRCNWLNMMIRVFLPVAAPGLVAAGIFSFLISWKDFLFALMFTASDASKTIPVVVAEFVGPGQTPRTLMATGGVLAVIPPLILALIFQRLIVQGLVAGAVKG
jgi:multiple sugar transport system permease protein